MQGVKLGESWLFLKELAVFQDQLSLNEGQKNCRMLQGEHSAILSTFTKLPFVIKIFVLSIFDFSGHFYTGFTVCECCMLYYNIIKNNS